MKKHLESIESSKFRLPGGFYTKKRVLVNFIKTAASGTTLVNWYSLCFRNLKCVQERKNAITSTIQFLSKICGNLDIIVHKKSSQT